MCTCASINRLFQSRPHARQWLTWVNRHFMLSVWSVSPGQSSRCGLFNGLQLHSSVTGVHSGSLNEDRSHIYSPCPHTSGPTTVVFVRLSDHTPTTTFMYDINPAEVCFILAECMNVPRFVRRLILVFASSWCAMLRTKPHEYGTRDVSLCLGSPLCCLLMRISNPVLFGGSRNLIMNSVTDSS